MFPAGQGGQKITEHIVEAVARFHRRKRFYLGLRADQDLQFRDHVGDQYAVVSNSFDNPLPPHVDPFITFR